MKMTSALAQKMIRQLSEEKEFWRQKEEENSSYVAAEGEEPVIPAYDYVEVNGKIAEIDRKVRTIKHAINVSNTTAKLDVQGQEMTVDEVLVEMAQLNARRNLYDRLRKREPKEREEMSYSRISRNQVPEYRYVNYDISLAQADFDAVTERIMLMQLALDKHNQTEEFEVAL